MNKLVLFLSLLALIGCKPSPKIVWRFQTQAPVYASPSIAGNLLVVGSQDHFLYALDLRTGKLVWKQDLGERIVSKPWIHDRAVYIGSGNGDFDCLDLATGRVRWKFKTGTFIHYDPCGDEDSVYFANNGGRFYKLNKEGKEVWSYKTGESHNWGQCVLYKNLVIATAWDGYCYALDRLSGNLVWRVSSGERNYWGPYLSGNEIIFGTHDFVARLKAENGEILAKAKTTYLIYAFTFHNFFWSLEETKIVKRNLDGTPVAELKMPTFAQSGPVILSNYFIVSNGAALSAVSPDLKVLWTFKGKETFWATGLEHEGIFYVGDRDGYVYALRLPKL